MKKVRVAESAYYPQWGELLREEANQKVVRWPNGDVGHYSNGNNTFEFEVSESDSGTGETFLVE